MILEEAISNLMNLQVKMAAYSHALTLLYYDGVTAAPRNTAANRGQTTSVLSEQLYALNTSEETVALLEFLDLHREELSEKERRMVFLLLKDIRRMQKIPVEEYTAHKRLLVEAENTWRIAKEKNDFSLFEPYLKRVFDDAKRFAGYCAPEMEPYDYWLNEFEEGLTQAKADVFFATVYRHIVPLLKKVCAAPQLDDSILHGLFSPDKETALSRRLMEIIGLDSAHVGLAVSEHPFTTSLGSHYDERITTHYREDDFSPALFSVIHEGGHALYDTGSDDSLAYTVLDGGSSMGLHESQSRFYENFLGRSRAFSQFLFSVLQEVFPEAMAGHNSEELYKAVNRCVPSCTRREADELTYCLHVMVRYELEKRILAGELSVHDLPAAWNQLYKEYLGVDVPDDSHGVLQDFHWAGGYIGYFPSYALGSAYGAQFLRKMKETVDVDDCLRRGDFIPINDWNRKHIWRSGCLYRPGELFEKVICGSFDPTVYTNYLEEKYLDLYDLK